MAKVGRLPQRLVYSRKHSASLPETKDLSMLLFKTVADLQAWHRRQQVSIGFVPTMGALHEGHLELVRISRKKGDTTVVSIFVNPAQFNDPRDLAHYPRTPGRDLELLIGAGCDAVFLPSVEEVYPPGMSLEVQLDFRQLDTVMEGVFRPGHFRGMATVVKRLLDIVQPQRLYMGQKDFQQLAIVRDMLRQLGSGIELVMCPTMREPDGLAMSSRNARLTPEMREKAPRIHEILQWACAEFPARPPDEISRIAMERLEQTGFRPEYFELVDGNTLLPVPSAEAAVFVVACVAVWAGEVRLIDNLVVRDGR